MGASVEVVYMAAMKVLGKFVDPALVAQRGELVMAFKPRPEDYDRVFTPEAAAKARIAYAPLWETPPPPVPKPGQTVLKVNVCEASELAADTPRARSMPGGLVEIADKLQPGNVWVAWQYLEPGADAGMSYNGLVYLDGRFVWFPKPWRFIDF